MYTASELQTPITVGETERPPPLSVGRVLHSESVRRIVAKLHRLPSPPHTYWELTKTAERPDASLADIARIVERDPAMSAKVLQIVNSAYFGIPRRIASIPHAVSYLGTALIKGLALTTHVFGTIPGGGVSGFSLEAFQGHSVAVGRLARRFLHDPKRAEEALTAALVHDIGKLVMAMSVPSQLAAAARRRRQMDAPSFQVERDVIGVTHAEVGAYLLGSWGLPFTIVEAVAYHHEPSFVLEGPYDVVAAVHCADAFIDIASGEANGEGEPDPPLHAPLDMDFLERAGFLGELASWRATAQDLARAA